MLTIENLPGIGQTCLCTLCRQAWHRLILNDYPEVMAKHHDAAGAWRKMLHGLPSSSGVDDPDVSKTMLDLDRTMLGIWDDFIKEKQNGQDATA